uniref:KEN domain-containing protein n=1 Tax=Fagus sylvatica TaxID=28930 RepID=A0A2N9GMV3_FAGSY
MDKGGPSVEAIQSTGCKIVLKCGHPHSSSEISDFKVESGVCCKGLNYNLDSDLHGKHIIYRHNPKNNAVLIYMKYKFTLRQWLEKKGNKDNWCPFYRNWRVYRPKEEASEIIQGILRAVYELHCKGSFHGSLYNPESFAIYDDESMIEGERKKTKCIILVHDNEDFNEEYFVSTREKIKLGQKHDMDDVLHVIFNKILVTSSSRPDFSMLPQDLQNLHELLQNLDVSSKNWKENWKRIVNHPSLWHWKSRFSYFDRVWMQFLHAKQESKIAMQHKFRNITVPMNWKRMVRNQMVPTETLLERVLNYNGNNYRIWAQDLLRYLRNVYVHRDDGVQSNGQLIEHEITVTFDHFLLKLYEQMWDIM